MILHVDLQIYSVQVSSGCRHRHRGRATKVTPPALSRQTQRGPYLARPSRQAVSRGGWTAPPPRSWLTGWPTRCVGRRPESRTPAHGSHASSRPYFARRRPRVPSPMRCAHLPLAVTPPPRPLELPLVRAWAVSMFSCACACAYAWCALMAPSHS
jgi:hypothetical protein